MRRTRMGTPHFGTRYETKKEAMDAGRRMSINQGTELIPHRKDGVIQRPDSHGNDPCPPKDRQ